ncbi:MAG: sigma-54 dependent transcriptional regulator [Deltaproteobacteria bacterium]|nr:sigma-54 dependent transcriptional regulator [Deltaproteobacteria bacterium]
MENTKVLVVDDDETFRTLMVDELGRRNFQTHPAEGVRDAAKALAADEFDVILLDLRLEDGDGLDVLRRVRAERPRIEVVVLTGHGDIDMAIEAMRLGAFDYLRKPCPMDELEVTIQKARERQLLIERNAILQKGLAPPDLREEFVGQSRPFLEIKALIERVAAADSSVLILGETGVGKDVVAKLIHAHSARRDQPLVVVQCGALHEDLLSSELFGHEKGAYTGATQAKHGLFEVANGGTIFLDEIGDVSPQTQVKLLRVLETGRFRRVGSTREVAVDVRIIAATNRDVAGMMEKGYFRNDLFYRLSTIQIDVPPLRERPADIPVLADHFLARLNDRFGLKRRFSAETMNALCTYAWPGNVRELLHVIERVVILSTNDVIEPNQLPGDVREKKVSADGRPLTLEQVECEHIRHVLEMTSGNRGRAASLLGISERTLYRRLKELGLDAGENGNG